jgi:hypothetical protein
MLSFRLSKFAAVLFMSFALASCTSAPANLSDKTEVIEVFYVNWACDCPDFAEANSNTQNPDYEIREEDCFYIEAAHPDSAVPQAFYDSLHFDYRLKLRGSFYKDVGVPADYEAKTPERPEKGRVFRYTEYELVKK